MGMYTGLRGKILLNDLGIKVVESQFEWGLFWYVPEIIEFSKDGRSGFIPYGVHCYMPSEWGESFHSLDGNVLSFSCSLKNYEGTIEKFIESVVPVIADAWVLEQLYEESTTSIWHQNKTLDSSNSLCYSGSIK